MKLSRIAVPSPPPDAAVSPGWFRRHPVWTGLMVTFAALLFVMVRLLSNLQWLCGPLQRVVSAQVQRQVSIGAMQWRWAGQPVLELRDVVLGNLRGVSEPRMVRLQSVQLRLSLPDLLHGRVVVPRIAVSDADVLLERLRDGRRNWTFGGARQTAPRPLPGWLRLGSVSLAYGRVRYLDHRVPTAVTVHVRPLNTPADARAGRHATRFDISGQYRGSTFSGHALSGSVLSLQDTGPPFPLQGVLAAGETRVQMEGTIANAAQLSGVDMRLQISGPTLANLYPFLLLPLPASPAYALQGRLRRDGGRFTLDDLSGQGSDVLRQSLDLSDLGPLIGLDTRSRTGRPGT